MFRFCSYKLVFEFFYATKKHAPTFNGSAVSCVLENRQQDLNYFEN